MTFVFLASDASSRSIRLHPIIKKGRSTRFTPSDETPMTPPKQLTAVSARVLVQLSPVQLTGVSARTSHLRLKNSNYEEGKISRF